LGIEKRAETIQNECIAFGCEKPHAKLFTCMAVNSTIANISAKKNMTINEVTKKAVAKAIAKAHKKINHMHVKEFG